MRVLLAVMVLAACSSGGGSPDAGGTGGGSSGGAGGGGGGGAGGGASSSDGGMLDYCGAGETPSSGVLLTMQTLVGGWHLWGQRSNGVDTAETFPCEQAKKFWILPTVGIWKVVNDIDAGELDAGTPAAMQLSDTACAVDHGVPLRMTGLGTGQTDYMMGCLVPCDPMDLRILWDQPNNTGYPYQYFPDGHRTLLSQRYHLETNGRLFVSSTGNSGILWEKGAGALYCHTP